MWLLSLDLSRTNCSFKYHLQCSVMVDPLGGTKYPSMCSKNTCLQTVLEAKREEFVDESLINAKILCEELEISFEPPRQISRKHIFGDGSKDVLLSCEDDLRRTMFSA
ncbi:uncharacterized protein TNCV_684601 [Trichonephila clavipes]|nr:uncharacterized protein TNCV_684601 [Trichonephila clavipes]